MNDLAVNGDHKDAEDGQIRKDTKQKSFTSIQGYVLHEILGKGSFGQVFKATKSGKVFAIKMIDKPLIRKKNLQKYVNNEVKVMRELKNPNTVRLYEAFEDKDVLYLVMECCNQGTLFNFILKNKPEEKECISIFSQIMKGFIEIHEKQILHRDLKPSNIFIKDGVFKIADFGLAKPKAVGSSYCGTTFFMAPEIIMKQVHDYKVDLWSMGVILFFMIFREYPFKNSQKILEEIKEKTHPFFDPYKCLKHPKNINCSPGTLDLFRRIFIIDPKNRISYKDLYRLDIVKNFFTEDELHFSSKLYLEIEKKLPQQSDEEEEQNAQPSSNKISKFKPSDIQVGKNTPDQLNLKHAVSLNVSLTNNLNNKDSKETNSNGRPPIPHHHNHHHHTAGEFSQPSKENQLIKTNGQHQEKEEVNATNFKGNTNTHENRQADPLKQYIIDYDIRFEDDNDQSGINDDDTPKIEIKHMKMLRGMSGVTVRGFGPKVFKEKVIVPISKRREEEEQSVPNAPSSFGTRTVTYSSFGNIGMSGGIQNQLKSNQQTTQATLNMSIQKKTTQPQLNEAYNNVTEKSDEESEKNNLKKDEAANQPIAFPEKEEVSNEENMKKMPIRKAPSVHMNLIDSAVKEKFQKQIIGECEQIFESHVQVYLYEIGIYNIVADTVDSLNVLNLGSSTQSLVNYLLAKLLLFLATKLMKSLQNQINIYKLQLFDQFTHSPSCKLLIGKINKDIDQWSMKFSLFYYGIDYERDIQSEEVRKVVTEELVETDFDAQLKIPIRLVLDLIFKASYKMGRHCTSQLQSSGILRTSLYILLSMLINSVFDKNKVKDYLIYYFKDQNNKAGSTLDFNNFNIWTAQASKEILLEQIHHLINIVFGPKKLAILKAKN